MAFSDVEMSILAQLAYKDIDVDGKGKKLSKVLTDHKEWLQEELGPSYEKYIDNLINKVDGSDYRIVDSEHDKASGFAAYAISTPHNEVVVACRGTQMDQANDILTDVGLGITPGETQQHRDMEAFVNRLEKKGYDGYYFTGHSLGGNVATHGATTVNDLDKVKGVYAYNAPGFNEAYWILNGWKLKQIKNITNFQNEYDYVSSVLRTPGRTVVIESSLDGNHAGFGDHSINGYTINENGYFQENETGEKHPQTYAGTAVGELGNSFLYHYFPFLRITRILGASKGPVYVYRDFSEVAKQKMLGLVTQVENEKWGDFTDWIGDRWYDFESWIGTLNIRNYINNVNTYHKKVIDKNNATEQTINRIFEAVWGVDASYATTLGNVRTSLEQWLRFVDTMAGIVEPGKGRFNGQYMASALNPILKDVSKANVQQIKDTLMQNVSGEPVFDEELLLEYIKKNPAQMTDEEKQAVLEVIAELEDTVAFYETAWSVGSDNLGAAFWNRAHWVSDTSKFDSFSAVSAHYNSLYVSILEGALEQSEDSNTFAAALLKICNGEDALTVLGLDCSADVSKIFGSASLAAYVAQWKTEHSEEYFAKLEISEKNSGALLNDIKQVSDIKKAGNQWLEDNGLRKDEKITKFYDENGNEISEKDAGFYDRDYTIAEIDATASVSASIYEGKFDVGENGEINVVVGNAEAHAGISAGLYVIGANGEKQFMPGVNAEVGASVTAFEADWEQQWLGDENLGLNTEVGVTAGKVGGKGELNAQLFSDDGKLDVQLNAEAKLEAIAVEAEGSVGVNVLGGEVEASAGINVGIGAHAEVGYKDGKFKFDVGASLGVGVSVDVEIDVGGMVDTVVDGAQAAWEGIKDGWNKLWDW